MRIIQLLRLLCINVCAFVNRVARASGWITILCERDVLVDDWPVTRRAAVESVTGQFAGAERLMYNGCHSESGMRN